MKTQEHKNHCLIWNLEGKLNNGKTWFIHINKLPFRIGRSKECHLILPSKTISRFHAEIHQSKNSLWVYDLGSTNGTFINKERVLKKAILKNGDTMHIADLEFRVSSRYYSDFKFKKDTQKA